MRKEPENRWTRRDFFKSLTAGSVYTMLNPVLRGAERMESNKSDLFHIHSVPSHPFVDDESGNLHIGIESLLLLMGSHGMKIFRSEKTSLLAGPDGLIAPDDVVLIKVNAQWKYRGATNSDLIRGLIQRILDHPDVFSGEIVVFDNGQGRGSLNCDVKGGKWHPYPDENVRANANIESHSFEYLVDVLFDDPRVSMYLLDPIRDRFIDSGDHESDGYRIYEDVSYPCFTTRGGRRVELREGIWNGKDHGQNLKLINVPVLKHHDEGGSEITASLKHVYGILSMSDGLSGPRHYTELGNCCGKMFASVCTPVLNIMDAIWVSHKMLRGYPDDICARTNQIVASQDPVALDYWAAKYILYPIDKNRRHHPDFLGIDYWLAKARTTINKRGGLLDIGKGIVVNKVTNNEDRMNILSHKARILTLSGLVSLGEDTSEQPKGSVLESVVMNGLPDDPATNGAGRYETRVLSGWSGEVSPVKAGYMFDPPVRNYPGIVHKKLNQDFLAYRIIHAPRNFAVKKATNRSLFIVEHFNVLSWDRNPQNENAGIQTYRIYDITDGDHRFIAETRNSELVYLHRNLAENSRYVYQLVAVNASKRGGIPSQIEA